MTFFSIFARNSTTFDDTELYPVNGKAGIWKRPSNPSYLPQHTPQFTFSLNFFRSHRFSFFSSSRWFFFLFSMLKFYYKLRIALETVWKFLKKKQRLYITLDLIPGNFLQAVFVFRAEFKKRSRATEWKGENIPTKTYQLKWFFSSFRFFTFSVRTHRQTSIHKVLLFSDLMRHSAKHIN